MNRVHSDKSFVGANYPLQNVDKIDELYRPYLIHPTTYVILTEQIMTLMPAERNIILTMNEYDLSEINPSHPKTAESPTHVIIFCIRFLSDGLFQPIGALMIYKYENQSKILAECVKAYINDLWKIGLYVVATVSPPFETFKGIMSHLVKIQNFNFFSGVISYSVAPFKEIIHIYDVQFLLIKLQNLFKESDIYFEEGYLTGKRHYQATWADISYVLTSSKEFKLLSEYFTFNQEVPRRVHIFSEQIYAQLMEAEAQGILSHRADGSLVLLNCIRTFLKFLEQDLVDVKTMTEIHYWDCLIDILKSMQFQKSKSRTCTKETPLNKVHVLKNPTSRRKIDFENDNHENKKGKSQTGKSKSRKKRKKLKPKSDTQKSGKDLREEALSKILSDDTTVTVHFFNGFESSTRSQIENCDIGKNNNSSSDDCSKTKPSKTAKKKSKLKHQKLIAQTSQKEDRSNGGGTSKNETFESKGPLKYPRISLREFSRLSAEEENVLNNENLFNKSKQNVLNNNENFKELPSSGGCLKKSITDILNSLNNVQFYSNFSTKNTNVETQNVINVHKDTYIENASVQTKDISTCDKSNKKNAPCETNSVTSEYLLNNTPKSYGAVESSTNSTPIGLVHDLSKLSLNSPHLSTSHIESINLNCTKSMKSDINNSLSNQPELKTISNPDLCKQNLNNPNMNNFDFDRLGYSKPTNMKSNLSDLILSGTDLGNPKLTKFHLNKPNLSKLDLDELKKTETEKSTNKSNLSEVISSRTDLTSTNLSKFNLNGSNVNNFNTSESDSTNLFDPNSGEQSFSKTKQNLSIYLNSTSSDILENKSSEADSNHSVSNFNKTYSNLTFNLSRPEMRDFNLNKSNLNKPNLSSLILSGTDLSKPSVDLSRPNLSHFESSSSLDFNKLDTNKPNSSTFGSSSSRSPNLSGNFCEILDFSKDHFCSKSDEETENSIKASCDNVPNILELLSTVEKSPTNNTDINDFENNSVTFELLCSVYGIERLFNLLYKRRVRVAKPDAFIVEHIDFLVTIIKERNKITSPAYYGNSYALFNAELAISTLQNNIGLYLVSK